MVKKISQKKFWNFFFGNFWGIFFPQKKKEDTENLAENRKISGDFFIKGELFTVHCHYMTADNTRHSITIIMVQHYYDCLWLSFNVLNSL